MLPLSFVEGQGFRKLMDFVEPEYTIPGQKMITSRLELAHQNIYMNMKETVEKTEYIAIMTACWTLIMGLDCLTNRLSISNGPYKRTVF